MNIIQKISILSALTALAGAASAETVIDRLPFTASEAGETYVLSGDLSTGAGAISVTADNVVIDGRGHTITFATNSGGNGVSIDYPVTSLEVKNLTLQQGDHVLQSGEDVYGIYRRGNHRGLNIHDNTINIVHTGSVSGAYGWAMNFSGNDSRSYGNRLNNNVINVTGTSAGYGIHIASGAGWQGEIGYNKITLWDMARDPAGYGRAIAIGATGPIDIHDNVLDLKSSLFQVQGISSWGGNRNIIRDNVINAASYKTRAILIDGNSDDNRILRNKITMTSMRDDGDASAGIRIRFGSDRNMVYQNEIDASHSVMSYPIRVGGSTDFGRPQDTVIRDNTLRGAERAVSIEDAEDVIFYNNDIASTGDGWVHAVYVMASENVSFNGDKIDGQIRFNHGTMRGFEFCATGVTADQISVGSDGADYRITDGNCAYPLKDVPRTPTTVSAN